AWRRPRRSAGREASLRTGVLANQSQARWDGALMVSRREFLAALTSSYVGSGLLGAEALAKAASRTAFAASMTYGYAAITWGAEIVKAIEDIAAVGFGAIQLRGEAFTQYGDKPKALRGLLETHKLTFAVLSSGNLS